MDAGRLNINLLMDEITRKWLAFDLDSMVQGGSRAELRFGTAIEKIGVIRIYFQPADRPDEFDEVVWGSE